MAAIDSVMQEGLLVDRNWLKQHGIDYTAVDYYLRSGRLEAIAHGVYRKPGPPLKWQSVVYSLNQLGYGVHVGHTTALSYHGLEHYIRLGRSEAIRLYGGNSLPGWLLKITVQPGFMHMPRNLFTDSGLGITDVPFGTWDWPIPYSSPERAFMELCGTLGTSEEITHARMMLEGAANLRPGLLQNVLEACTNIKAKRLFLWMARCVGHPWYDRIDTSRLELGTGKRQIVPNGVLDREYLITVPKEESNGQTESLF
jgi:hypothetical protein